MLALKDWSTPKKCAGSQCQPTLRQIQQIHCNGVLIQAKGNQDSLRAIGDINSIQVTDSIHFPNSHFEISSSNDHSVVSIKASADNTLNDAAILSDVYTIQDGARISFRPSSFVLNEKKWNIEPSGELVIRNNFIDAKKIHLTQGFQEILLETEEEDGGNTNNLIAKIKNVFLGDISSVFSRIREWMEYRAEKLYCTISSENSMRMRISPPSNSDWMRTRSDS